MTSIVALLDFFNFQLPGGRWQLVELCDLWIVPETFKNLCQNTLTAQWTKRLPIIQRQPPAELAAKAIHHALLCLPDLDTASWSVIDFCSGAGGPIPYVEKSINLARRRNHHQPPIPFRLSDLHPNIDAWIEHASHSANLSFVPQPVDASNPPFSVISSTTQTSALAAGMKADAGLEASSRTKVFRLFCLSFHHFDDETARKVLKSTFETSDAFAIVELQDRRVWSLLLMLLEFWLLMVVTVFWFLGDGVQLFWTYCVPVLPAVHGFDGIVSCLRTRDFGEVLGLVEDVLGKGKGERVVKGNGITVRRGEWLLSYERTLHTWPVGYMTVICGRKFETSGRSFGIAQA